MRGILFALSKINNRNIMFEFELNRFKYLYIVRIRTYIVKLKFQQKEIRIGILRIYNTHKKYDETC